MQNNLTKYYVDCFNIYRIMANLDILNYTIMTENAENSTYQGQMYESKSISAKLVTG